MRSDDVAARLKGGNGSDELMTLIRDLLAAIERKRSQ